MPPFCIKTQQLTLFATELSHQFGNHFSTTPFSFNDWIGIFLSSFGLLVAIGSIFLVVAFVYFNGQHQQFISEEISRLYKEGTIAPADILQIHAQPYDNADHVPLTMVLRIRPDDAEHFTTKIDVRVSAIRLPIVQEGCPIHVLYDKKNLRRIFLLRADKRLIECQY
jgi:hypothetical protein